MQQSEALVAHTDALGLHHHLLVEHRGVEEVHINVGYHQAAVVNFKAVITHLWEVVDLCEVEEIEIGIVVLSIASISTLAYILPVIASIV